MMRLLSSLVLIAGCGAVESTGADCVDCAQGDQNDAPDAAVAPSCATSGVTCGSFGECSDATGTPTCVCKDGMTGAACDTCPTSTQALIWDTFGGSGEHHTIPVTPGAIVVAQLPSLPTTSNGPQATGTLTFAQVPGVPEGKYTLAFSRCPGDVTAFSTSQVYSGSVMPCRGEFLFRTGLIGWTEAGPGSWQSCHLPPGDGPWYANITVDFDPVAEDCAMYPNGCVINWNWW